MKHQGPHLSVVSRCNSNRPILDSIFTHETKKEMARLDRIHIILNRFLARFDRKTEQFKNIECLKADVLETEHTIKASLRSESLFLPERRALTTELEKWEKVRDRLEKTQNTVRQELKRLCQQIQYFFADFK